MPSLQGASALAERIDADLRRAGVNGAADRRIRASLVAVFVLGTLLCIAVACAVCRSLYADGGYVVLGLLRKPMHYIDYDFYRSFASFVGQTPVFLGQRLGLANVTAYAGLYTFAVDGLPLLAYVVALVLARDVPRLFAATALALAVFGFGANFTNSEGNLFLGLAWLAGVLLALPERRRFARGIVLPALALALLRVYEGMLLAGPILAAWAYAKAMRTDDVDEKIGLVLATLGFAVGGLIGFSGYVAPRDAGNAAGFAASLFAYGGNPQVWLLLAAAAALVAVLSPMRISRPATLVSAALGSVFFAGMVGLHGYQAYGIYYDNRAFLVLSMPVVLASLAVLDLRGTGWLHRDVAPIRLVPVLVPFAAVVLVDLLGSARWFGYMNAFCDVLADPASAREGVARLTASGAVTGWSWTHPTLSILLRRSGSTTVVPNEPLNWEPFDPATMKLTGYRGACENRRFGAARHPGAS